MTKRKKDKMKFPTPDAGSAAEKIKRRRLQVLVHSCMYYELDQSIVDDQVFDGWCKELVELQKDKPVSTRIGLINGSMTSLVRLDLTYLCEIRGFTVPRRTC